MAQAAQFVSDAFLNTFVLKDFAFSVAALLCGILSNANPLRLDGLLMGLALVYTVELFLHHCNIWQEDRADRLKDKVSTRDEETCDRGEENKVVLVIVLAALVLVELPLCPGSARVIGLPLIVLASLEVALPDFRYCGTFRAVLYTCRSIWLTMSFGYASQQVAGLRIQLATHLLPTRLLLPIVAVGLITFGCKVAQQIPFLFDDWQRGVRTLAVETDAELAARIAVGAMFAAHLSPVLFIRSLSHGGLRMIAFIEIMLPLLLWMRKSLILNKQYEYGPTITVAKWYAALCLWLVTFDVLLSKVRHQSHIWANVTCILVYIFFVQLQMRVLLLTLPWTRYPEHRVTRAGSPQKVIVCGGGVGGLLAAACLQQMGMPYVVVERREENYVDDGADLGLWPSAIKTLKLLGVPAKFFEEETHRISKMNMKRLDNGEVLKVVNLDDVVEGTGESFMLVSRLALMETLRKLVDEKNIMYGSSVTAIALNEQSVRASVRRGSSDEVVEGGVLIGADGAHSLCRRFVEANSHTTFKKEVCYRGVLDLGNELVTDKTQAYAGSQLGIMELLLGERIRYSLGFLSRKKDLGYWFVKQRSDKEAKLLSQSDREAHVSSWPSHLQELYRLTESSRSYVHSIEDISGPLSYWSRGRVVLLGDAAHPVTPNSAQGACLAIDDAITLAVLLRLHVKRGDGHVKALYYYERKRKAIASIVAGEARLQMKIAHLSDILGVETRNAILRLVPVKVVQRRLRLIATPSMNDIHALFRQFTSESLPLVTSYQVRSGSSSGSS